METIKLPESATKTEFAQYVNDGEIIAYTSVDQNGDIYTFDDIGGKVGDTVVRFARVMKTPEGKRRSTNSEFAGWKKEIVGKIVDVRHSPKRTLVRYDIDKL
jgi:hypothetical protein